MRPAYSLVAPRDTHPEKHALFLHGILGSRSNWRTLARRWVQKRSGWGSVLVDLRMHGDSQDFPPPHTVETAARDLLELDGAVDGPLRAVLGHSFGGKVALAHAAERPELEELWIVDSLPGARPDARGSEDTLEVVDMLGRLPRRWDDREEFVARVVSEGREENLARWLAMNLASIDGGGYELRLDLGAIGALLDDYFARDLWHVVESPPGAMQVHVVIGDRSSVFEAEDRERARRAAEANDRVHVHVVDAGHWVHVEAPEALLALMT